MQNVFDLLSGTCVMLLKRTRDNVEFLGTAFAIREDGFLATTAHILEKHDELMISPAKSLHGYQSMHRDKVDCMPVNLVSVDEQADVALLKLTQANTLRLPKKLLGETKNLLPGTPMMRLGFSLARYGMQTLLMHSGHLAVKLEDENATRQLLVEGVTYPDACGGPLIDTTRSEIVGVITNQLTFTVKQQFGFAVPDKNLQPETISTELTRASPIEIIVRMLDEI